jgi:hypothetical protein
MGNHIDQLEGREFICINIGERRFFSERIPPLCVSRSLRLILIGLIHIKIIRHENSIANSAVPNTEGCSPYRLDPILPGEISTQFSQLLNHVPSPAGVGDPEVVVHSLAWHARGFDPLLHDASRAYLLPLHRQADACLYITVFAGAKVFRFFLLLLRN